MAKANVLRLLLREAKKQHLYWLVQQSGENLFPEQDHHNEIGHRVDYDEWKFTDDIEATIKYVEDIGNMAAIVFSDHYWAMYCKHYNDHSAEDLCDYLVTPWLDKFADRLYETHD